MPKTSQLIQWSHWPAPVLNGLSVGLGLAVLTALIGAMAGMPAAITAASGASTTSVADTVCAPQAKRYQMVPAVISTALVAALVAWSHATPWALTLVVLLTTFGSIFWMSWGKRGGPQTFVMVLTLVFQMAAFTRADITPAQIWQHLGWVTVGALSMALWSELSIRALASRYRTLALVDSIEALSTMMRVQAQWTRQHRTDGQNTQSDQGTAALLALIQQQAGIADVFQSARDLLYSQADAHTTTPAVARQIQALIHTVNLRDVVQSCQLDLDRLPHHAATPQVVQDLADQLDTMAMHLSRVAQAWRAGLPLPPHQPEDLVWPHQEPVLASLGRRCAHMRTLVYQIASDQTEGGQNLMRQPLHGADLATTLRTLVSPNDWGLPALKAQLNTQAPVMRYAARATLAIGCADGLAHVLPWTSHPHWILMTVAVVMRGNLEQTLARRDARIQGTLVGCLLASALLTAADHSAWLFVALVISLSLAHGFVQINYRVTAAAGAVLALVQGHLFTPGHHAAFIDAAERLGDTLIGAMLAWAFSYVLPSWERQQLPRLAGRLLRALGHYTHHALHWHEAHAPSPLRSHARREVYEVLNLLAQSLQRMGKEPAHAKAWAPELEAMLIHSHRLISHLAAIKGLLTVRHQELISMRAEPMLRQTEDRIKASLRGQTPELDAPRTDTTTRVEPCDLPPDEELAPIAAGRIALTDWLLLRLAQTDQEARQVSLASQRLRRRRL